MTAPSTLSRARAWSIASRATDRTPRVPLAIASSWSALRVAASSRARVLVLSPPSIKLVGLLSVGAYGTPWLMKLGSGELLLRPAGYVFSVQARQKATRRQLQRSGQVGTDLGPGLQL